MQKCLTWFLIVLTAFSFTGRVAYASIDHPSKRPSHLKAKIDNLPPGTRIEAKLKSDSEVEGTLVAGGDEGFELAAPKPTATSYSDVRNISEDPGGQASPGSNQSPGRHQSHFARNALIGLGIMCVIAVTVAVAAK